MPDPAPEICVSAPPSGPPESPAAHVPENPNLSPESPERVIIRKASETTTTSHNSASTSTTAVSLPSMRWVQTLQKLTTAKAGQAKQFAEARREHRKTHEDPHPADCHLCLDFATRCETLMAELESMDRTLRDMEDSVIEEVREYKAARRREKREQEVRDKEVRQSAAVAV